jgi:hypothetical protein
MKKSWFFFFEVDLLLFPVVALRTRNVVMSESDMQMCGSGLLSSRRRRQVVFFFF